MVDHVRVFLLVFYKYVHVLSLNLSLKGYNYVHVLSLSHDMVVALKYVHVLSLSLKGYNPPTVRLG